MRWLCRVVMRGCRNRVGLGVRVRVRVRLYLKAMRGCRNTPDPDPDPDPDPNDNPKLILMDMLATCRPNETADSNPNRP